MKKNHKKISSNLNQNKIQRIKNLSQKNKKSLPFLKDKDTLLPPVSLKIKHLVAGASLAGTILLAPFKADSLNLLEQPVEKRLKLGLFSGEEISALIKDKLLSLLTEEKGKLTLKQEEEICQLLKNVLGIDVCSELEGFKLNYNYGLTGYEQHLKRYPGDTLEEHKEELEEGIAPGLGAWGYFAPSKKQMSEEDYLKEKYYIAVQTLYFDDWNERSEEIYNFFKHRKMLMVSLETGKAVVVCVADAGPAQWTGKVFGASPETIKALGSLKKGGDRVLLMFVKDKENKVPLGPLDYNLNTGKVEEA